MSEALEVRIPGGTQADLWTGVNVAGDINLLVRTRSGTNQLELWWITWGFGGITRLGVLANAQRIPIPISWWRGVVSARLRASASEDTVVYLSDKVAVDYSKTFSW